MNPYYVGPQVGQPNTAPADYLQGAQAAGSIFAQGFGQGSMGEQNSAGGVLNSALQGAATGAQFGGPVGAAAGAVGGAVLGEVSNKIGQNRFVSNMDTSVGNVGSRDASGQVTYNAGALQDAQSRMEELQNISGSNDTFRNAAFTALGGLGAGAALFGLGDRAKRKAREKQAELQAAIEAEQGQFNRMNTQAQEQFLQREAYNDRLNNVFNIPMGYY